MQRRVSWAIVLFRSSVTGSWFAVRPFTKGCNHLSVFGILLVYLQVDPFFFSSAGSYYCELDWPE